MHIRVDDLSDSRVQDLLALHFHAMRASSPPASCHVLDLTALKHPDITVWTAWDGDVLLGVGALKRLDAESGEVKSMRTDPAHLGKGVGAAMLEHIITTARVNGHRQLLLETGNTEEFTAATALYRKRGFTECPPFGDYQASVFNRFMRLDI
jgi:putative acetyltransferase